MRASSLAVVALVLATSAFAATPFRATLTTSTPKPIVDKPWRWTVTVKSTAGKPLPAKMKLQILLGETVVGCWKGTAMVQCFSKTEGTWILFRGKRAGVLTWPAQSLGVKLTFQAVVVANKRIRKLQASVTVQPAPPSNP
jgi:hypothetical protein